MFQKVLIWFLLSAFFLTAWPVSAYLPSDPLYSEQSYLAYINIPQAWDIAQGAGVTVAILDSGVDINHPDLKFNIWKNSKEISGDGLDNDDNGYIDDTSGWDFVDSDNDPSPVASPEYSQLSISHGTALAGLIGSVANNGLGLAGIAFNSKIMPLRILQSDGEGLVETLVEAINYAVKNGADIINLSLVGFEYNVALENAVRQANQSGVLIVAAAGNAESDQSAKDLNIEPAYPACYGNNSGDNLVVAVSSLAVSGQKSAFSNYGADCIDLSALGEDISSLAYYNPAQGLNNYYSYNWYGTSFSTAIVSGVAALAKSKNLSLDASDLTILLKSGAENIDALNPDFKGKLGTGRIDALKVLNSSLPATGKLIKLNQSSAVYYLDSEKIRHLFPNQNIFFSWYNGTWKDQTVEIVSQEKFDSFKIGQNVIIRPGTKLVKFQNSGRLYAVSFNGLLHNADSLTLTELYGDYDSRVVTIQNSFESDYTRGEKLSGLTYPDGSLIQYDNSDKIWYLEAGQKRELTDDSLVLNGFRSEYIIKNVNSDFYYNIGRPIKNLESNIFTYFLTK
ncbi:MAG: hypothetical protein A3B89_00130 [Candidatus Buchananbacteria bacterium RIFCSPHIGHO2_02_FULL_40_13]|uniref:Peptidase S8/S53 domain-containing protein n=1 Tax=Candidatus Buchananbacteria bacterium RIFCSPLOWO2_01_FULL_39_33 TaxID=1797543 RepID=A0A1G1YLF9_9BACT|nr:MAG: hypothetical protein A3B89_00130 [Candidatus Buchananbacteria bacterium RIFCSPHIGHO2_02_FULL_40_13]OGY52510.1 MAG: hypothetical protein A3A02_01595 [Candidatus Buchananbacteria bacterium RIFCSPLOWO2_01_FULL_39_33]